MTNDQPLEPTLTELSHPGRVAVTIPAPISPPNIPKELLRDSLNLPEISQLDVVRHYTRLSQLNYSIDTQMYPLGSCTMKLNPKVNDAIAAMPGFAETHPMQTDDQSQGVLAVMHGLQRILAEVTGMDDASLAPLAGAQGELAGVLVIKAYLESIGEHRTTIVVPDSAHGTNPATASMAGFNVVTVKPQPDGDMDLEELRKALEEHGPTVAALMITQPSTLGLFDRNIVQIAEMVHGHGALMYGDGANLNAIVGQVKPGDLGFDVMHINLHKTFSQPHGGGGPGAGPIVVKQRLAPFLPSPHVRTDDGGRKMDDGDSIGDPSSILHPLSSHRDGGQFRYHLYSPKSTIGRLGAFSGNFGVLLRAYSYIMSLGADGLRSMSEAAVLNANYLRARLAPAYDLAHEDRTCMHEALFSARRQKAHGVKALDIAKRLIDYGYHPPTMYFPLVVEEALLIEPTESESKESIDAFCAAMLAIAAESESDPELVRSAPHTAPLKRLDEATAARKPKLRW
jgi:glycine dehydrogenase subunit 2